MDTTPGGNASGLRRCWGRRPHTYARRHFQHGRREACAPTRGSLEVPRPPAAMGAERGTRSMRPRIRSGQRTDGSPRGTGSGTRKVWHEAATTVHVRAPRGCARAPSSRARLLGDRLLVSRLPAGHAAPEMVVCRPVTWPLSVVAALDLPFGGVGYDCLRRSRRGENVRYLGD